VSTRITGPLGVLAVTGQATLGGATAVNNTLTVSGQATLEGPVQAQQTLAVTGQASLNGGGSVSGTLTNGGTISGGVVNPASGTVSGPWTVQGLLGTHYATNTLSTAYTTTSTTAVSTGMGVSISSPSTALQWLLTAIGSNNTAGDGIALSLYRSTTGIPAAGAAPGTGDVAVWGSGSLLSSAAGQQQAASGTGIDTGLTSGTTYYYYLAVAAVTGGTASVGGGTSETVLRVRAIE